MDEFVNNFITKIDEYFKKLSAIESAKSGIRTAEGKWAPREIIGHLIDSAANNHQRFVRIQQEGDSYFPLYAQEEWVRVQSYNSESWEQLLNLWKYYNLHIAHVVRNIPDPALKNKISNFTSEEVSWIPAKDESSFTLEYLIRDYEGHLVHHLDQIFKVL